MARPTTPNVLAVYARATEGEREYGEQWYPVAHAAAARIAKAYGSDIDTVAAVISALSPSNVWHNNLVDAERFVEEHAAGRQYENGPPVATTYPVGRFKAWDILHGMYDHPRQAFETGTAKKTLAFYECIARPYENTGTVVVDGHAWNIATSTKVPLSDVPNLNRAGRYCGPRLRSRIVQAWHYDAGSTGHMWRRGAQLSLDDLLLTTERI